jgi:hypothetical protein
MNPNQLRLRAEELRARAGQNRGEANYCDDPERLARLEEDTLKDIREAERLEIEAADLEAKAKRFEIP